MDLMNYKIIVDYAYEELQKLSGAKNSHPDKYKKALSDWKTAKRLLIRGMNNFIEAEMGKDVIVFEYPNNLKEKDESV